MIRLLTETRGGYLTWRIEVRCESKIKAAAIAEIHGMRPGGGYDFTFLGRQVGSMRVLSVAKPDQPRIFRIRDELDRSFVLHGHERGLCLSLIADSMVRVLLEARTAWKVFLAEEAQRTRLEAEQQQQQAEADWLAAATKERDEIDARRAAEAEERELLAEATELMGRRVSREDLDKVLAAMRNDPAVMRRIEQAAKPQTGPRQGRLIDVDED